MKIFYDNQIFVWQKYGGISRYFVELFNRLPKYQINLTTSVLFTENEYYNNFNKKSFPVKIVNKIGSPFLIKIISKGFTVLFIIFKKFDIYHPTQHNYSYIKYCKKKPYVITIYDMTQELYPQYFSSLKNSKLKVLCENASHIISISETTKNDIVKCFAIPPEKISTIYLAGSFDKYSLPMKNSMLSATELLFVGYRSHYKNFSCALRALFFLRENKYNVTLLCIGGGLFTNDENALIKKLNLEGLVKQKELSEPELASTYQNALALIYPSFYEGFGIPLIEAMSCFCPIVVSDIPVFREIAEDTAQFFDPQNPKEASIKIEELINNHNLRNQLINSGKERSEYFSWEKTAMETAKIYRLVMSK